MRIAICDDEESQRALIIKYLQEWAVLHRQIIETASYSGAEAFLFTWEEDKQFDLLILDIEMGTLSGMELILDSPVKIPISRSSYKSVNQAFIANYGLNREK